jgi:hypothetical protein
MTNDLQDQIDTILAQHPDLCRDGYGRPCYVTPAAWPSHLAECRARLRGELHEIGACRAFLSGATPTAAHTLSSYAGKHRVEHALEAIGAGTHISNGAFIVAALASGFTMRLKSDINPLFNIHRQYLSGKWGGLPFRPALSEEDMHLVDLLVERVESVTPRRQRRAVSTLTIASASETVQNADATALRLEGVCGSTGKYLVRRPDGLYNRWSVATIGTDVRPLTIAAEIHLELLGAELDQTIAHLQTVAAKISPDQEMTPALDELVAATRATCAHLGEIVTAWHS